MKLSRRVRRTRVAARASFAVIVVGAVLTGWRPACAIEATAIKESAGATLIGTPCALPASTDGTAANYRWYNLCSGYIWIFGAGSMGERFGVLFGGPEQPKVNVTNIVKRAITYWRNIVVGYSQTVDIFVEPDFDGDGCPDANWLSDLRLDPGLRWNCSEFDTPIPSGVTHLVVGFTLDGGAAPTFATDGPFSRECDPPSPPRSYYYGLNGSACRAWIGPDGTDDNFLHWLVLDRGVPNATEQNSWGAIKRLFR